MSQRTISDADVAAIVGALKHHECPVFTEQDRNDIKTVIDWYRDSRTAVRKGIIGLILLGCLALAILGVAMQLRA